MKRVLILLAVALVAGCASADDRADDDLGESSEESELRAGPPQLLPDGRDPFDSGTCTDAPLSSDDALELFTPGSSKLAMAGNLKLYARHRACHPATGCADWTPAATGRFPLPNTYAVARVGFPLKATLNLAVSSNGDVTPHFMSAAHGRIVSLDVRDNKKLPFAISGCDRLSEASAAETSSTRCDSFTLKDDRATLGSRPIDFLRPFKGVIGTGCVWLSAKASSRSSEFEVVIAGRLDSPQ